jgi:hypothetical protein
MSQQAEILTVLMFEVLGTTMFAWLIGNVVALVLNIDPAERNRKQMMGYLNEYIRYVCTLKNMYIPPLCYTTYYISCSAVLHFNSTACRIAQLALAVYT